ncbi:hypothetical protein LY78DRAFT_746809 [Colletotrichum sublineola]|uniref:Uncharacterized protein n=1 Tax=Colletotrichum sublineola TaxID=1173701 RepID=A0A066XBR5_COLSU|nr:hypothetical protein LY78DRAFT_746809 [Colletotrichum sublineola]KDN66387.1 hypothetical protein CSUB01_06846 [Colletotrichum sublineola]
MDHSVNQLEDTQMQIEHSHTPLSAFVSQGSSVLHDDPTTPQSKTPKPTSPTGEVPTPTTPVQSYGQARVKKMRQNARESRWIARDSTNEPPSPATLNSLHMARGRIEKKTSKKWKSRATDSRLSIELDRLLVGDDASRTSIQQSHAIYRIQHPLRAVLHSLPGFTYDTELDSVTFRKHKRVLFGIEGLMEEGGRDAAKEWLEGFLLLTFETMNKVLESYPLSKELDDVPNGFLIMARDMEAAVCKLPCQSVLRSRRAMERRLCQSYDLRRLVEWTLRARRRFLESKPKIMPGFGTFGQAAAEKGTALEERLWALVDARKTDSAD